MMKKYQYLIGTGMFVAFLLCLAMSAFAVMGGVPEIVQHYSNSTPQYNVTGVQLWNTPQGQNSETHLLIAEYYSYPNNLPKVGVHYEGQFFILDINSDKLPVFKRR
jgi:hypothetical protein